MRSLVFGMILVGLIIGITNILVGAMGYDPSAAMNMPYDSSVGRLMYELTSPTTKVLGVMLILFAGMAYAFGLVDLGGSADEPHPLPAGKPAPIAIKLSPEADAASRRVRTALLRLSKMPADVMLPEIQVEYDAIRSRHVPDLEAAHAKARRAVADDDDVAAVDAEYAASLSLISNKLNDLLDDCEIVAGRDLAVQARFIETRHPPENDGTI